MNMKLLGRVWRTLLPTVVTVRTFDSMGRPCTRRFTCRGDAGPGLYSYEWIQDGGYGGAMICECVVRANSFEDAVRNGQHKISARHIACHFAYQQCPRKVARLPDDMQGMTESLAEEALAEKARAAEAKSAFHARK
jgi:hypothetical protein